MLELEARQRALLIDKLPDAANVAAGALVFGQFLTDRAFSPALLVLGGLTWVMFVGYALALARKQDA